MLIPVLATTGKQIARIDNLKLEEGSLFRMGEWVFRSANDGTLRQVPVGIVEPTDLVLIAIDDL